MFLFLVKAAIMLLFCFILVAWYHRYRKCTELPSEEAIQTEKASKKWGIIIACTILTIYGSLALLLSFSWLAGDDFMVCRTLDFTDTFYGAMVVYMKWVSRFGEILNILIGLAENRWQQYILTPLFICALPFALYRLVKEKGKTIFNAQGCIFIIFIISLLLGTTIFLVPGGGYWRNFWCYAASTTYLWPLVGIAYFLSFFRKEYINSIKNTKLNIVALFFLGLYVGWSIESCTVTLLSIIIGLLVYRIIKKQYISPCIFSATLGLLWGAFFLFASTALSIRAATAVSEIPINIADMNFREAFEFVCNLTPENIKQLRGGAIPVYINDFPLILRVFFLPELMSRFLPGCAMALGACTIGIAAILIDKRKDKKGILIRSGIGIGVAVLMVCTYLQSCIPTQMSFFPARTIIVAVAGYLLLRIKWRSIQAVVSLTALCCTLSILIPAGIEAYHCLPYREAFMKSIHEQINAGKSKIVLLSPYPKHAKDRLRLIEGNVGFHSDPKRYPNSHAARYFKVKEFIVLPNTLNDVPEKQ